MAFPLFFYVSRWTCLTIIWYCTNWFLHQSIVEVDWTHRCWRQQQIRQFFPLLLEKSLWIYSFILIFFCLYIIRTGLQSQQWDSSVEEPNVRLPIPILPGENAKNRSLHLFCFWCNFFLGEIEILKRFYLTLYMYVIKNTLCCWYGTSKGKTRHLSQKLVWLYFNVSWSLYQHQELKSSPLHE